MMNLPSFASSIRLVGQMLLWGGWLVPALLAWQRLLDYLNDDLARLQFTQSSALMPMPDINEAANIAAARQWMLVAGVRACVRGGGRSVTEAVMGERRMRMRMRVVMV